MSTDRWPQPPFHPKDYSALLELLGPEEFERRVCPLDVARERWQEWRGGPTGTRQNPHRRTVLCWSTRRTGGFHHVATQGTRLRGICVMGMRVAAQAPRAQAHSLQQGFCTILPYLIGLKNCECE